MIALSRFIGLIASLLVLAIPLRAQVVFTLGTPVTDNFPIVDVPVYVTENGAPAPLISGTDFTVREDGIPGNVISLTGCGGTSSVAIALVVDTSQSMQQSLGSGPSTNKSYGMFDNAVSKFVASIPGPSLIALVPFADSSKYFYPDSTNTFYNSANRIDTGTLGVYVRRFKYIGRQTDVVAGIVEGAKALSMSTLPRKVMILVTDDNITNVDSVKLFLNSLGIRLYVLDVSRDSTKIDYADLALADSTGGAYFAAYDTTLYEPMLLQMSHLIFSEHCILEYRSAIPCPAWNLHHMRVTLNYKGSVVTADTSYFYARVRNDVNPPHLVADTPSFTSRRVRAYDPFPCETGMRAIYDSLSNNFTFLPRLLTADSMSDSIIVTDSLYPADAWVIAIDTAGNISRKHLHYVPKPDTHAPQFDSLIRTAGRFTENVTELLPWDRGIDSVYLSGALNLVLDSVRYTGAHLAHSFLHIPDPRDTAVGCLVAFDSVGNRSSSCLEWDGEGADTLPPVITQLLPPLEPLLTMDGTVTEERPHDRGIRFVTVTPITNVGNPQVMYDSAAEARVTMQLGDSLYPASALVQAIDSMGNESRDTFEYVPRSDTHAPLCTYVQSGESAYAFSATDTQAWDRGIAFLLLLGQSTNAAAAPTQFQDGHHAQLSVSVIDRTLPATIVVQATDSAGHQSTITVHFAAIPLIPLGDSVIDFGTVFAPSSVTRTIVFQNQNDIPVSLDLTPFTGDDSVFHILTPSPIVFPAFGSNAITIEFDPTLVGSYRAVDSIEHHIPVGSVTMVGHSMGTVRMALDTAIVGAGSAGVLHLSLSATPEPTNLDTIGFTLTYDPDVIQFGDLNSCSTASPDTGLCIYNAYWSGGVSGNRQAMLVRNTPDQGAWLSFDRSKLSLPFTAFVAKHDSTIVHIEPLSTYSASVLSTQDGLVVVSNACGDQAIRTGLNGGDVTLRILSIAPNPASGSLSLSIESAIDADAEISIFNVVGGVESSTTRHLVLGCNPIYLEELPRTSGAYEVVVRTHGVLQACRTIEVIR